MLLSRPRPLHGESLRGYFLRLSESNGLLPSANLHEEFVRTRPTVATEQRHLASMAACCGLSEDHLLALAGHSAVGADPARMHFGHRIAVEHLRSQRSAICPHCVARSGSVKASWELRAQAACADHACWLIDKCGRCRSPLSWRRRGVGICRCGADLTTTATDPAPASVAALAQLLEERLHGLLDSAPGAELGFPPDLPCVPLNELLALFYVLRSRRFRAAAEGCPSIVQATPVMLSDAWAMQTVAQVLAGWPTRWHRMLGEVGRTVLPAVGTGWDVLFSRNEPFSPLTILDRARRVQREMIPGFLVESARDYLSSRAVSVGNHVLYRGKHESVGLRAMTGHFQVLRASGIGHGLGQRDTLSRPAARQVLGVTEHQLRQVEDVAELPAGSDCVPARKLDEFLAKIHRRCMQWQCIPQQRRAALSGLSRTRGAHLKGCLEEILLGRRECFLLTQPAHADLGNLGVDPATLNAG